MAPTSDGGRHAPAVLRPPEVAAEAAACAAACSGSERASESAPCCGRTGYCACLLSGAMPAERIGVLLFNLSPFNESWAKGPRMRMPEGRVGIPKPLKQTINRQGPAGSRPHRRPRPKHRPPRGCTPRRKGKLGVSSSVHDSVFVPPLVCAPMSLTQHTHPSGQATVLRFFRVQSESNQSRLCTKAVLRLSEIL